MIGIIILLGAHWICDFIFQSREMAIKKGSSIFWLLSHVTLYTMWMGVCCSLLMDTKMLLQFMGYTFGLHLLTDYFTSQITAYYFKKGDMKGFFTTIGADQLLHTIQLLGTVYYLQSC